MLTPILESTRARLETLEGMLPELRSRASSVPAALDFAGAVASAGLQVVAEIKRRSPSAGPIAPGLDAAEQAMRYERGGAAAISVLTEPHHFDGSLDDLVAVRRAVALPVLRKDFILDPVQIWESRAAGADAILLIVAALDDDELRGLYETATEAGMAALVEVHTAPEAERALVIEAAIVGVNNRDLTTFRTDLATAESLSTMLGGDRLLIGESGVSDEEGARRMAAAGYDAILVGEALVRAPDPAELIGRLRGAGTERP